MYDFPSVAVNPEPGNREIVSPELNRLSWQYIPDPDYSDPLGFRVYMNTTGAFGSNAPYWWVDYQEDETDFNCIIDYELYIDTVYYWRVVPTTIYGGEDRSDKKATRQNKKALQRNDNPIRGDAQNCPIWMFTTSVTQADNDCEIPLKSVLYSNYPNPFNPETTVSYTLVQSTEVEITIYNSRGQKVKQLLKEEKEKGNHSIVWHGVDSFGNAVPSGIYYTVMTIDNTNITYRKKMLLLK